MSTQASIQDKNLWLSKIEAGKQKLSTQISELFQLSTAIIENNIVGINQLRN